MFWTRLWKANAFGSLKFFRRTKERRLKNKYKSWPKIYRSQMLKSLFLVPRNFKFQTLYYKQTVEWQNTSPCTCRIKNHIMFISNYVTELLLFSGLRINDLFIMMWQSRETGQGATERDCPQHTLTAACPVQVAWTSAASPLNYRMPPWPQTW